MTQAEKIEWLAAHCQGGFSISFNDHRVNYASITDELEALGGSLDLEPEVRKAMVRFDRMVVVQAYPKTPIGFYRCVHHNLDAALDEILSALAEEGH